MKKRRWVWLLALVLVLLAGRYIRARYFGPMTCGVSEEAMLQYVEGRGSDAGREVQVLKVAREGRVQGMLYEEYRGGALVDRYLILFERQLFGLRLRQVGMNTFGPEGLCLGGSWHAGPPRRCAVEVYGDNRGGGVAGYSVADAPEVHREDLEADYILDIYILDGIDRLPRELQQVSAGEGD